MITIEIAMIGVVGGGVIVTGIGLTRLWIKNGKEASRRDGILDTKLKDISRTQAETREDIAVLSQNFNDHRRQCASITSGFTEKIKALEREGK